MPKPDPLGGTTQAGDFKAKCARRLADESTAGGAALDVE